MPLVPPGVSGHRRRQQLHPQARLARRANGRPARRPPASSRRSRPRSDVTRPRVHPLRPSPPPARLLVRSLCMNRNFIGGAWRAALSGSTLASVDPSTGQDYGAIADSGAEDVDLAVKAARQAFDDGAWGQTTAVERGRMLTRLSGLIQTHARGAGRTRGARHRQAADVRGDADVAALARYFEFYGGAADKWHGETIPYLNGYLVAAAARAARRDRSHPAVELPGADVRPHAGAVAGGRQRRRAEAGGRRLRLVAAARRARRRSRISRRRAQHRHRPGTRGGRRARRAPGRRLPVLHRLAGVGQQVQKLAADHFIPCTLELGGKSPQVVFADADFDAAVPVICRAIVQNAGQTCSAGSRVLVERTRLRRVRRAAGRRRFAGLRPGVPEMDLDCGPIINAKQKARVQGFIDRAAARRDSTGRGRADRRRRVRPTASSSRRRCSAPCRGSTRWRSEEVFGPVLAVHAVRR